MGVTMADDNEAIVRRLMSGFGQLNIPIAPECEDYPPGTYDMKIEMRDGKPVAVITPTAETKKGFH